MQKKKGISLIVLVITIIVMIILAAAIIISLNNSGIIGKANKAVNDTNEQEVNHIAQVAWGEAFLNGARTEQELREAVITALENNGIDTSKYIITATTKGVTVTKGQGISTASNPWVQDGINISNGKDTLEAGDLIQYDAGVSGYSGAWKVLGAEDGKLLIMSTTDVSSLVLLGLEGGEYSHFNQETGEEETRTTSYGLLNAISRLNTICSAYGTGTGAVGARSIKVEDVDKLTGYDKTTYGTSSQLDQYGNEVTYSWNTTEAGKVDYTSTNKSGTLSTKHSNGFSYVDFDTMTVTTVAVNASGLPKLTNTCYTYSANHSSLGEIPTKTSEMIFGGNNNYKYWLASPFLYTFRKNVRFGLHTVSDNGVNFNWFLDSTGYVIDSTSSMGVRAVVELSPNIKIGEKDEELGWSYTI